MSVFVDVNNCFECICGHHQFGVCLVEVDQKTDEIKRGDGGFGSVASLMGICCLLEISWLHRYLTACLNMIMHLIEYLGSYVLHAIFSDDFFVVKIFGQISKRNNSRMTYGTVSAFDELNNNRDSIYIPKKRFKI